MWTLCKGSWKRGLALERYVRAATQIVAPLFWVAVRSCQKRVLSFPGLTFLKPARGTVKYHSLCYSDIDLRFWERIRCREEKAKRPAHTKTFLLTATQAKQKRDTRPEARMEVESLNPIQKFHV